MDNLIALEEPDGNIHQFSYDASGEMVLAKDKMHEASFAYGPLGVLKRRTQNNRSVYFDYDTELQLCGIINEGGEKYRFDLDGMGQVIKETGFDGLSREYIHDGAGRVREVIRPGNRRITYTYDDVGNIVREEHHDESWTAYRYNPDGLLKEAINENGVIRFKHDRAGRIIEETQGEHSIKRT